MSLRSHNRQDAIYAPDPPTVNIKLGQLWVDTDSSPPQLFIATSLSPVTYSPVGSGGGGGAPDNAEYIVAAANGTLTAERVATATATVSWNFGTPAQALANVITTGLDLFDSTNRGVVPGSGGGTTNFLRADGTWAAPPGGGGGAPTTATYVTLTTDATLTNERTLAGESTVVSITDGGAGAAVTVGIEANGITNAKLRQGAANSVIGRAANTVGNVADISAAADGEVLRRAAGTVGFGSIPVASVTGAVPSTRNLATTAPINGGGDLSADRTLSLANNGITDALFRQSAAVSVVGRSANSVGNVADIAAGADNQFLVRRSSALTFATLVDADIPTTLVRTSRNINTTAPLAGGGSLAADLTLSVGTFGAAVSGVVPASGGGTTNFLRADGTWAAPPGGGGAPTGAQYLTLATDATLTNERVLTAGTNIAFVDGGAGSTLTLNVTGTDLSYTASTRLLASSTGADVTLPLFTSTDAGLVPASGGGTTNFLRADGTWAAPGGGGGGQSAIQFQEEGANLGAAGTVDVVNFTGAWATASRSTNTLTVDIPAQNLNALTDVVITAPAANHTLVYDGSNWVNQATQTILDQTELNPADPAADWLLIWDTSAGATRRVLPNNLGLSAGGGFTPNVLTATPSGDQQDWNPGTLTNYNIIRATPADNSFISGFANPVAGAIIVLVNASASGLICLIDEDTVGTAANRLALGVPLRYILPNDSVTFYYDGTASRWVEIAYDRDPLEPGADGIVVLPNTTTSVVSIGAGATSNTATLSTTEPAATPGNLFVSNAYTQITNAAANGSSDVRGNTLRYHRGATANRQGIFYATQFRNTALGATGGILLGMTASTAAITTQARATNNTFGVGTQGGETTHRVYSRDGAAATAVDLGANFPAASATAAYAVAFLAMPNTANIRYMVLRLDSRFTAQGTITTNLPANTQAMAPRVGIMVGATATATTAQFNYYACKKIK